MTENSRQSQVNRTVHNVDPLDPETASASAEAEREQCTKTHALCEGQCKLDKGHEGSHECQECGLYFG
jgi:hypothetical protein